MYHNLHRKQYLFMKNFRMPLRFYSWCSTRGAHGNLAQSCPAHVVRAEAVHRVRPFAKNYLFFTISPAFLKIDFSGTTPLTEDSGYTLLSRPITVLSIVLHSDHPGDDIFWKQIQTASIRKSRLVYVPDTLC